MPEISDRPITSKQVKAIHLALAHHDIPDREYRERLRTDYGVQSCKDLTRRQASELLSRLGLPLARPPGARVARPPKPRDRAPAAPGVTRLASPLQRRLIEDLVSEIAWRAPNGYTVWLRRNMGLDRVASAGDASRVIEGLKALRRRGGE